MKSYSKDLRERVLKAYNECGNVAAVARRFDIGRSTVHDLLRLYSETGDITPKQRHGRRRLIEKEQFSELQAQVEAEPDATLEMHRQLWASKTGVLVSEATMCRTIARLKLTLKKNSRSK